MPAPQVEDLPPHLIYIEPIQDRPSDKVTIPSEGQRAYTNLGWVLQVPRVLEEHISIGDLVVFQPWSGKHLQTKDYHSYRHHYYMVHEDDCLLIIEDW